MQQAYVRRLQRLREHVLKNMTVKQLREMAREKGIEGYAEMKKAELIKALKG